MLYSDLQIILEYIKPGIAFTAPASAGAFFVCMLFFFSFKNIFMVKIVIKNIVKILFSPVRERTFGQIIFYNKGGRPNWEEQSVKRKYI